MKDGGGSGGPGAPAFWKGLLSLLCHPQDRPYLLADLEEEFRERARGPGGEKEATRWYRSQTLRSALPLLRQRLRPGPPSNGTPFPEPLRTLRFALRGLGKSPLVVMVTVLSLTLGIGASASVFTVVNAFLFQESAGVADPEGVVAIYTSEDGGRLHGESSFPDYLDIAERARTLEGVAAVRAGVVAFDPPPDAPNTPRDRILVEIVTGNFFRVMGIRVPRGRGFLPEETRPESARPVIVISHRL